MQPIRNYVQTVTKFIVVFAGLVHDGRTGDSEVQALSICPEQRGHNPPPVLHYIPGNNHAVPVQELPHRRVYQLAKGK